MSYSLDDRGFCCVGSWKVLLSPNNPFLLLLTCFVCSSVYLLLCHYLSCMYWFDLIWVHSLHLSVWVLLPSPLICFDIYFSLIMKRIIHSFFNSFSLGLVTLYTLFLENENVSNRKDLCSPIGSSALILMKDRPPQGPEHHFGENFTYCILKI